MYTKTFTLPNGQRKYVRAKTKEELEAKVTALKMQMQAGVDISDNTTVGEFIQMWVDVYKRPNLTPKSMSDLLHTINTIILPPLGALRIRSVKPIHIQNMMSDAARYSHRTQSKALSTTRAIFNTAVDNGLIMRSPVPATMKAHGTTTEAMSSLTHRLWGSLLMRPWWPPTAMGASSSSAMAMCVTARHRRSRYSWRKQAARSLAWCVIIPGRKAGHIIRKTNITNMGNNLKNPVPNAAILLA